MTNEITIELTREEIDDIFAERDSKKWEKVLGVYIFLRENLFQADAADISAEYQRKFNYFYQVRRNEEWRKKFYSLFSRHSKEGIVHRFVLWIGDCAAYA